MTDANVKQGEGNSRTSSSLLRRVKAQDQQAWQRLVRLYAPLVYHWCRQAGLQAADAADVGQEVFEAVARKITDFRHDAPGDTFCGWLRTITQNKLRDHARSVGAGRQGVGGSAAQELLRQLPADASASSDGGAMPEESQMLYRRAIELIRAEFEEGSWQAFWQVVVEERRPEDVARQLGTSVNAVYLAKSRILRRLREEFADLVEL